MTSKRKIVLTEAAPAPVGPYSQAVVFGELVFCSGQIAIDPKTNQVMKGSVAEQTKLVMSNIQGLLKGAGSDFSKIIKTNIFLKNMSDFATVNEIYSQSFIKDPPARSTVEVSALPKGVDVEIEVIAHI